MGRPCGELAQPAIGAFDRKLSDLKDRALTRRVLTFEGRRGGQGAGELGQGVADPEDQFVVPSNAAPQGEASALVGRAAAEGDPGLGAPPFLGRRRAFRLAAGDQGDRP